MPTQEQKAKAVDAAFAAQIGLLFTQLCARKADTETQFNFRVGFENACNAHAFALKVIAETR